jgi:hypothetical protein
MSVPPNPKRKAWLSASPAPRADPSVPGKPNMDAKRQRTGKSYSGSESRPGGMTDQQTSSLYRIGVKLYEMIRVLLLWSFSNSSR